MPDLKVQDKLGHGVIIISDLSGSGDSEEIGQEWEEEERAVGEAKNDGGTQAGEGGQSSLMP